MTENAVTLGGVSKSFGRVRAVDTIDLSIGRGETIALLGANGAGKTTTLSLLLGLLNPDAGMVRVCGMLPRRAVADGRVGAMLQEGGLTTGVKVRELVRFVRSLYADPLEPDSVLETVGLTRVADRLVTQLSGGQAQRLRLALALVGNPDLLVLDEPTAGMDVEARRAFWAVMRAHAAAGRTLLFATHYLEEADDAADRIVVLVDGRVAADGPATGIKAATAGKTVRFTLDGVSPAPLDSLPGVTSVELRGKSATLHTADADATVRALYNLYPRIQDLEVASVKLEDAYVALTESE